MGSEILFNSGMLFQEWVTDGYIKIVTNNLKYHNNNQDKLRADH